MYPGKYAASHATQPAVVMAGTGETITYGELEARSNRLAHLLRARGLGRLDHYSICMENNVRYVECCAAGERAGHYYTCVNSFLTAEELGHILNNSRSKVLITSQAKRTETASSISIRRRRASRHLPSPTNRSARPCSIRRAPRAARRASCGRCQSSRRSIICRSSISC
jgi:long-chain acyl-CoA synthetase